MMLFRLMPLSTAFFNGGNTLIDLSGPVTLGVIPLDLLGWICWIYDDSIFRLVIYNHCG